MERTGRSWRNSYEVGKFWLKLESLNELGTQLSNHRPNFPTSSRTLQLQLELSNFSQNFPTSARTFQLPRNFQTSEENFQLCSIISNFARLFPTWTEIFQLHDRFNYTYPSGVSMLLCFQCCVCLENIWSVPAQ